MNQDALTHISRFLQPKDLQTMSLVSRDCASAIRGAYRDPKQKAPIRAWNHARKQFYTNKIGATVWLSLNLNMFPYLDHVEMMFDMVIEEGVHNLLLRSYHSERPTDEQFRRFVNQVITRNHRLETITLCEITITDDMYEYFFQALRPRFHEMSLLCVSFAPARCINAASY
jgi:hypothetical protein